MRSEEEMVGQQDLCQIPSRREIGVAKPSTPLDPRRIHSPSFPLHNASSQAALTRKSIAFIETKNPQTHPGSISLGANGVGQGG
jgi:hypothetical protein